MTSSEALVARLCQETFLSQWSLANPRGKEAGKELCDVIVVCDPDVIVISVKEVTYKATPDVKTGMDRWTARAVTASIKQIYGAERALQNLDRVIAKDGSGWLYLPPVERRRIHRLAVAMGSRGEIPITDGKIGEGFVHVLDEEGLVVLMRELDTITDFVEYLQRTEAFLEKTQVIVPGIESLLALYLQKGRQYPDEADLMILTDDLWKGVSARDEFKRKKEADRESYFWDGLIEHIAASHDPALTEAHGEVDDPNDPVERVTRIMAREDRFSRRLLSKAFREFHRNGKIRSRVVQSPSGVVYVFLVRPKRTDRTLRRNELLTRMFIARGMHQAATIVVGLATEECESGTGFSIDSAAYLKKEWTAEDQTRMESLQRTTGAFEAPSWSRYQEDEYPPERSHESPS